MAEANARPVLPASSKAASIVAAAGAPSPAGAARQQAPSLKAPQSQTTCSIEQQQQQQQGESSANRKSPRASDQSGSARPQALARPPHPDGLDSTATGDQPVADTLASNLRKMIVSSSASLSRKFNITSSGSISALTGQSLLKGKQQQQPGAPPGEKQQSNPSQRKSSLICVRSAQLDQQRQVSADQDFESRQAGYQHPVIKPCIVPDRCQSAKTRQPVAATGSCGSQLVDEPINVTSGDCTGAYLDSSDSERTSADGCPSLTGHDNANTNQPARIGMANEIAPKR